MLTQLFEVLSLDGDPAARERLTSPRVVAQAAGRDSNLSGLEAFTFAYHVQFPLSLVFSTRAMLRYQTLFRFLFYLKHVERLLLSCALLLYLYPSYCQFLKAGNDNSIVRIDVAVTVTVTVLVAFGWPTRRANSCVCRQCATRAAAGTCARWCSRSRCCTSCARCSTTCTTRCSSPTGRASSSATSSASLSTTGSLSLPLMHVVLYIVSILIDTQYTSFTIRLHHPQ